MLRESELERERDWEMLTAGYDNSDSDSDSDSDSEVEQDWALIAESQDQNQDQESSLPVASVVSVACPQLLSRELMTAEVQRCRFNFPIIALRLGTSVKACREAWAVIDRQRQKEHQEIARKYWAARARGEITDRHRQCSAPS